MSKTISAIFAAILQAIWSVASIWYAIWAFDHGTLMFSRFLSTDFNYGTYVFLGAGLNCLVAIMAFWGILSIVMIPGWFHPLAKEISSCIAFIPFLAFFIYLVINLFKLGLFEGSWWLDILAFILIVFIAVVIFFALVALALPALMGGGSFILESLLDDNIVVDWISTASEYFCNDDSPVLSFIVTFVSAIVVALIFAIIAALIATVVYFAEIIGNTLAILLLLVILGSGGGGATYIIFKIKN